MKFLKSTQQSLCVRFMALSIFFVYLVTITNIDDKLVKLPYLLAAVDIEDDAISIIKSTIVEILKFGSSFCTNDFIRYLVNNLPSYPSAFEPADPTYVKIAL